MRKQFVLGGRNNTITKESPLSQSKANVLDHLFLMMKNACRQKAAQWVRCNAPVNGKPNMTAATFREYVNSELLPATDLPPGCPHQIKERTAI